MEAEVEKSRLFYFTNRHLLSFGNPLKPSSVLFQSQDVFFLA